MPTNVGVRWVTPPAVLAGAIELYGKMVVDAVVQVAEEIDALMEADAKQNHPWTNRTGDAEAGLFGKTVRDAAAGLVSIYLSHGTEVDYGIWLEINHGGAYAVIMRTIEAHLPELQAKLNGLLQG